MKRLGMSLVWLALGLAMLAAIALSGCASPGSRMPLTVCQVNATRDVVDTRLMRHSGTVVRTENLRGRICARAARIPGRHHLKVSPDGSPRWWHPERLQRIMVSPSDTMLLIRIGQEGLTRYAHSSWRVFP